MAEWIVERGIGEIRAALIEGGRIVAARIVPDGELIAGTVLEARLIARMPECGQGIVAWHDGEALVSPLPAGVTQGALCLIEIVRPAIPEPGKPKRALARPASSPISVERGREMEPSTETVLAMALETTGLVPVRDSLATDPDMLEAGGWSELLEQAATGQVAFRGGALSLHLTPAMTLIDIDGTLAASALSIAGAEAAAQTIRRLDLAGSIGIDLPGADKAARHAAAAAIDAILPPPFERTAVNGFGFVQIVRPRRRRSLPEVYAGEPSLGHARALLRRAERVGGVGERTIAAHPAVIAQIAARPAWTAELSRRIGAPVALHADPAVAISAGHVQARFA